MKFTAKGKNALENAKRVTYKPGMLNEYNKKENNFRENAKSMLVRIDGVTNQMSVRTYSTTGNASFGFYNKDLGKNSYINGKIVDGIFYPNKEAKNYPLFLKWVENYGNIESEENKK